MLTEIFHSIPQPARSIFLSRTWSNPGPAALLPAKGALPRCFHSSTWRPAHTPCSRSSQRAPGCGTPAAADMHTHKRSAEMHIPAAGGLLHKPLGEVLHSQASEH